MPPLRLSSMQRLVLNIYCFPMCLAVDAYDDDDITERNLGSPPASSSAMPENLNTIVDHSNGGGGANPLF